MNSNENPPDEAPDRPAGKEILEAIHAAGGSVEAAVWVFGVLEKKRASDALTKAIEVLQVGDPSSERELLTCFERCVERGLEISPNQQRIVNVLMAKVIATEKYPKGGHAGRPKNSYVLEQLQATQLYLDFREHGQSHEGSVTQVADTIHKDSRTVLRYLKACKSFIGDSAKERQSRRADLMRTVDFGGGLLKMTFTAPDLKKIAAEWDAVLARALKEPR